MFIVFEMHLCTGTHFMFFSQLWINKSYIHISAYVTVCVCSSPHFHLVALWLLWPHRLKDCSNGESSQLHPLASDLDKKFSGKRKAFHDICSSVRDVVIILLSMCWSERALDYFALGSMTLVGVCLRWDDSSGLEKTVLLAHILDGLFYFSIVCWYVHWSCWERLCDLWLS